MRVAVNALAVSPGHFGGDATYVRQLLQHLPQVAPDDEWIVFVLPGVRASIASDAANVRYVNCKLPGGSLVVRALWEQMALPRLLARMEPDVLHAPVNVAPLLTRVPTVLTLLEAEPFMPRSGIPLPLLAWWRLMRMGSAKRARQLLTISHAARGELARWMRLPLETVRVVHLGVDHMTFFPKVVPSRVQNSAPYVLWVGRTYPRKNVVRLVAAFGSVADKFPDLQLVLAGTRGWVESDVAEAIAQRGQGRVWRTAIGSDLADWYRAASVFVFPSLHEAFGLPIVEAMACGTPVVAADIPALREVADMSVEFVDPMRVEDIARGLNQLLSEPSVRESLRSAGMRRAAQFTWDDTARLTYAAYRAAVSQAPSSIRHE